MNGTGRIRKVDYPQECGHCNKPIDKGTDYVYYHKGDYSKRWVMPVHVECYKELQCEVPRVLCVETAPRPVRSEGSELND